MGRLPLRLSKGIFGDIFRGWKSYESLEKRFHSICKLIIVNFRVDKPLIFMKSSNTEYFENSFGISSL